MEDPGNWVWSDGEPVSWTNWVPNQPSRFGNYVL